MDLNGNRTETVKRIIGLEGTSDPGKADRAFFRFCLRRQPGLWMQVLPHVGAELLFGLGLLREESYQSRFWRFTRDLKDPEKTLSVFAERYTKRHLLYLPDEEAIVVSAWPQPFAEALLKGHTVHANPFRMKEGTFSSFSRLGELLEREAADTLTEAVPSKEGQPCRETSAEDKPDIAPVCTSGEDGAKNSGKAVYDTGEICAPDGERSCSCIVYGSPFRSKVCGAAQMLYCVRSLSGRVRIFRNHGAACAVLSLCHIVPYLLLAVWSVFLTGVSLYDASITHDFTLALFISYFKNPLIPLLNLLPVLFLSYLFYAIAGSCAWSLALTSFVTLGLSWGNYFKMLFRNDPVIAEDIRNIALALEFSGQYHISLGKKKTVVLVLTVLVICLAAVFVRRRALSGRFRAGMIVVLLLTGFFGLNRVYFSDSIYDGIQNYSACNRWSQTDQFISRGFFYPFLHSFTDLMDTSEPEGYSNRKAEAILSEYQSEDIPEDKRVNLIFIQLEAFADFSELGAFSFEADPYAYWHMLEDESYSGSLLVNIFAGGTVDTERSVMCGFSSLPSFRQNTMSYVWYFREQGYQTVGAHPCNNWFYNRRNVNSYLGFSEYLFSEDTFSAMSGGTTAPDSILFPFILERYLSAVDQGTPLFSFNVSYQGHGPYSGEERLFSEEYCSGEGVSQESYYIVNNYLASVSDTQEQLKVLVDGLRGSDAPVVLILFGDHMPWLGDGNSVYTEYGVNLSLDDDSGLRNYYSTPYLIWANDRAKEITGSDFTGEGPMISPCFLMNLLFRQCGYEGDAFLQIAGEAMDVMPVLHSSGLYDERFLPDVTSDPEAVKSALDRYLTVQYYRKHHFSAK